MQPQALLRCFVAAAVLLISGVLLLNGLVDPYGFLGTPGLDGLTSRKPTALMHDRLFKVGLLRKEPADCLLAGSSRVGEGISPDHQAFRGCRRVLDLSLAGPNVAEMTGIVQAAQAQRDASLVLLSLDFFAFNATRESTRGGQGYVYEGGLWARARSILAVLGSADVAVDSIRTLFGQHADAFYQVDGSVDQDYLARIEGQRPTRSTFLRGLRGYIFHHLPAPQHRFALTDESRQPQAELKRFLVSQHAKGTQVHMFFSPAHAWQWELIDALGLWPLWEQWKREVVATNESAAAQVGRSPFPLWDFASYEGAAQEPVPEQAQSRRRLENYWDSSHFKRRLGSLVVSQMLEPGVATDMGTLRNSSNVEEAILLIRAEREAWRRRHPDDVALVREVVACYAPAQVLSRLKLTRGQSKQCQDLSAATR